MICRHHSVILTWNTSYGNCESNNNTFHNLGGGGVSGGASEKSTGNLQHTHIDFDSDFT